MTQDMTDEFQRIEFSTINMIDSVTRNKEEDEVFAKLNIKLSNRKGTHCLQTKVDTGAQGNLLPVRVFRQMFPESLDEEGFPKASSVKRQATTLLAYNDTIIKQYGSTIIQCQFGDSDWQYLEFYIAEAEGPVILGLPSSRSMNVVTINCNIQKAPPQPAPCI